MFAYFGGCYYLSQAHSVRTCVDNVWSCWLSVGIRVSIGVDLAFALQELQGKQFFMEKCAPYDKIVLVILILSHLIIELVEYYFCAILRFFISLKWNRFVQYAGSFVFHKELFSLQFLQSKRQINCNTNPNINGKPTRSNIIHACSFKNVPSNAVRLW